MSIRSQDSSRGAATVRLQTSGTSAVVLITDIIEVCTTNNTHEKRQMRSRETHTGFLLLSDVIVEENTLGYDLHLPVLMRFSSLDDQSIPSGATVGILHYIKYFRHRVYFYQDVTKLEWISND